MTLAQAAETAGRTQATIRNWQSAGRLGKYRVGHRVYVDAAELDALLQPIHIK